MRDKTPLPRRRRAKPIETQWGFPAVLFKYRQLAGLTQRKLAEKARSSGYKWLNMIEVGRAKNASALYIGDLARVLILENDGIPADQKQEALQEFVYSALDLEPLALSRFDRVGGTFRSEISHETRQEVHSIWIASDVLMEEMNADARSAFVANLARGVSYVLFLGRGRNLNEWEVLRSGLEKNTALREVLPSCLSVIASPPSMSLTRVRLINPDDANVEGRVVLFVGKEPRVIRLHRGEAVSLQFQFSRVLRYLTNQTRVTLEDGEYELVYPRKN